MVSVGHVGGTRGSGIVSSAPDVQWRRGVGEMCMCLTRGGMSGEGVSGEGVSGEGVSGLGLGFINPVGTGGLLDCVSVLGLLCGGVCGEWVRGLDQGLEEWCYVCVRCGSGFAV